MTHRIWLSILLLFALQITGCSLNQAAVTDTNQPRSGPVLKSTDGQSQITLPEGWKEYRKLNDAAELQAANLPRNLYVIVVTENKEDYSQTSLKQYATAVRDELLESLTSPEVKGPKKVIINGHPGMQFEIKGQINNTKIGYLLTAVETGQHFFQVLAWTSRSGFEKNQPEIQRVIHSFKEVTPGTAKFSPNPNVSKDSGESGSGAILKSTDGQSQITLPGGWKEHTKLNDSAELQAANLAKNLYIVVLTESKEDFDRITLEEHSAITRERLTESLSDVEIKGPWNLTIKGNPAIQFEIRGQAKNYNVAYLHTTIETSKNFYQVLAWSGKSGFDKNRAELLQVIGSFKEINSNAALR